MPSFRTARVIELLSERDGLQRIRISFDTQDDPADMPTGVADRRAYALTQMVGPVAVGDEIVVNTTAVDLNLGTGGWDVVHWNLSRRDWHSPGGGHIMKLRYTSVQTDAGSYEEHHGDIDIRLDGLPVIVCTLHSQVGVVAAAFAHRAPQKRLVYVMTDGGALPMVMSDLVAALRERRLLSATVTAGHAFGGDAEAVSVPSALAVAREAFGADAVVVGMGPGVVGTGSALGSTAVEQAAILDAANALGATAIACVRVSDDDRRTRHRGISHHVRTNLTQLTHTNVSVPVPLGHAPDGLAAVAAKGHRIVELSVPDVGLMLASFDLTVTSMGRGPADDPAFFRFAAAAGLHGADLANNATQSPGIRAGVAASNDEFTHPTQSPVSRP